MQNFDGGDYDDDGGFDDGDYGDDDVGIVDDRVGFEASANNGTERTSCMAGYADLIDAEPQVENIELAYATIAKRVDVRFVCAFVSFYSLSAKATLLQND